jgi:hypothetical protein
MFKGERFNFEAVFADKKTNAPGLQIADVAAYPISHFVRDRNTPRPDWKAVQHRIRRGEYSRTMFGYGLKIFP